jgi:hypothetical protein
MCSRTGTCDLVTCPVLVAVAGCVEKFSKIVKYLILLVNVTSDVELHCFFGRGGSRQVGSRSRLSRLRSKPPAAGQEGHAGRSVG